MNDPKTLDEAFQIINDELLTTFLKKHKDYGKGNILSIKELGIAYRLAEKTERLKNLLLDPTKKPENESIRDNTIDIAVYAVILELYRRGWFQDLEVSD